MNTTERIAEIKALTAGMPAAIRTHQSRAERCKDTGDYAGMMSARQRARQVNHNLNALRQELRDLRFQERMKQTA